jgi:hypothetical protein
MRADRQLRGVVVCLSLVVFFLAFSATAEEYSTGDPNCSGFTDIDDVVYLINFIFGGGPAPCNPAPISGEITGNSPCRLFMKPVEKDSIPLDQDCVEYAYDGAGVLDISHLNAGLNCCPVFAAEFSLIGNVITIEELDSLYMGGCDCLCLFDIDYQIQGITPGVYTLRVIEPYLQEPDEELLFEIDLTSAASGAHCENRTHYPWGYLKR